MPSFEKTIIIIVFFFLTNVFYCQNLNKYTFESSVSYGRIIPHRSSMKKMVDNNAFSIESTINFHTNGKKTYHHYYLFPSFSWTLNYTNSGNADDIGNILGTYGSVSLPLSKKKNPLCFKLGLGAGWIDKTFDLENNFQSVAIGSHVNMNVQLKFEKKYRIKSKHQLKYGILLNHLSNGSYKLPNLGLNILQFQASYSLGVQPQSIDTSRKDFLLQKKHGIYLYNSSGFKETQILSDRLFYINETSIQLEARQGVKSSFLYGIDLLYNSSIKEQTNSFFQSGIILGHILHLNRLKIGTQIGCHVYNKGNTYRRIYNKIIAEYQISAKLCTRISLRSHLFTADFIGLGIGYKLN